MCCLIASVSFWDPQGVRKCEALRIDVHQRGLMHAVLCRPFGSRVAETLLRRLEALIGEASDEDALLLMQQVIALHWNDAMVLLPSSGKATG